MMTEDCRLALLAVLLSLPVSGYPSALRWSILVDAEPYLAKIFGLLEMVLR